ncbi:Kelch repeat-containing protein [Carboxylicivirga caseinilyticus]|uniref:Kelch repeat-containing protein n=1 Tax=Carboxylicivirga caseinilyticus TaxID=3417572 RepID=UPI003D341799|nr:hypothetical protein [Marinilabiliaceae bacterium A049]
MKTITTFFYLFFTVLMIAQSGAPQHFNYQTLIRNSDGTYVANTDVYIRLSILGESPNGALVYTEVHQVTTNDYGLISLKVGEGSSTDDFTSIDWGNTTMFVKVEASIGDDQNYFEVGTNPFSSVPYALYAEKTGTDYKVPSGTGILSFNPEAPEGYGFSGNTISTTRLEGQWESKSPFQYPRRNAAVCSTGSEIYVMGGENSSSFTTDYVEVFNLNDSTWASKTSLPIARTHAAAAYYDGKIYVIGGFIPGSQTATTRVDVYDLETGTWSQAADMNYGRWAYSVMISNNVLYAVSGLEDFSGTLVGNIESYNFDSNTWSVVTTIPDSKAGERSTILDNKIYVLCGSETVGDSYNINERLLVYDLDAMVWNAIANMQQKRLGYGIGVVKDRIVVCGGVNNGNYLSSTETYDPKSNKWFTEEDLPYAITCVGTFFNDEFWILGGQNSSKSKINNVERFLLNNVSENVYFHIAD